MIKKIYLLTFFLYIERECDVNIRLIDSVYEMALIENHADQRKNVFKKDTQVRLAIIEIMNEKTTITVKKISQRANISIPSIRNYIQDLERTGELITRRQGNGKENKILHMWLTEEAINATYHQFLTCLPENDKVRLFTLLEGRINEEK